MAIVNEIGMLLRSVWNSVASNWWLIALSVPLAVLARLSGIGEKAKEILERHRSTSIIIATLFGAFSPLCSCTVIPVVFGLLNAGIPIAPIMSFWIASPSMDPETLLLSVATLGWPLSIARLGATLTMSLAAGYITALFDRRGLLGVVVQKEYRSQRAESLLTIAWRKLRRPRTAVSPAAATSLQVSPLPQASTAVGCSQYCATTQTLTCMRRVQWQDVLFESFSATIFIGKFIILAFFLEAVIIRYVPQETVVSLIGRSSVLAPLWATMAGIPLYTTTIASLGLIGGLLEHGMSHGAALAFLIAGPVTTIPAMAAVYNVVTKRVFLLYLAIPTISALTFGFGWQLLR